MTFLDGWHIFGILNTPKKCRDAMPEKLESAITKEIVADARKAGWFVWKVAGGAFQAGGMPDIMCQKNGRTVWLEVKRPGNKPTARQVAKMREITEVGGSPCFVVTSREESNGRLLSVEEHSR